MLSLQDEACKLDFRLEMISYHSVHSHSFFSNNFARKRNGKISPLLGRLLSTIHNFFFRSEKKIAHVNVGYCFLISVMFHPSRLNYCFWSLESFKAVMLVIVFVGWKPTNKKRHEAARICIQ